MQKLLIISFLSASVFMGACSNTQIPFVHRIEIPQGNVVTKDMVEKLEPGLSKRQVTYIMGSPMLVDVFNQEQWIYLYSFKPGSGERVQRQLALGFENDALVRVSGDVDVISETPVAVRSAQGTSRSVEVPEGVGAGYDDGGILQGVIDRFKGLNPWSGDAEETTVKDGGSAGPAPETSASARDGKDTMRKFSLEEKDIGAGNPADSAQETPAPAGGSGGEATTPDDGSSKGWKFRFGSDTTDQAFAPGPSGSRLQTADEAE
ncbi:MAG: outer membrane protein assembly factor BamE [Gammaproteobacteria bacterium]|nr:outer membrane protein assembly factor BamE [Gammaproteobacteria bacterium]